MYELIIFSLLMRFPTHGYLIAKIINDLIGPYARISNGRLYPLLAKLEAQGLIEVCEEAEQQQRERTSRSYQITEAGRQRFYQLMRDTTSNPGEYQRIFQQKVGVLFLLKPLERLYLIDHYLNYSQAHVLHLTAEAEDLARRGDDIHFANPQQKVSLAATLDVMKHRIDQWRLEVEWALHLRQEEVERQENVSDQEHESLQTHQEEQTT